MKRNVKKLLSFILATALVIAIMPIISKPMVAKADTTQQTNHTHGAHADGSCSDHAGWTPISTEAELQTLCHDGGSGYLTQDINLSGNANIYDPSCSDIEVFSNVEVNLCLNGYRIINLSHYNENFTVFGTLTLYDENNNSGHITHCDNADCGTGVYVSGRFIMNGGTISGNKGNDYDFIAGGGVVCTGTFILNGGKISNNRVDYYGGGVFLENGGVLNMNGGEISGNTAEQGAGVFVKDGSFIMNGGEISGNTAHDGAGVFFKDIAGANSTIKGYVYDSIWSYNPSINDHSVTLNANGGTENPKIQYFINSEVRIAPNPFTKPGYSFHSWNTAVDRSGRSYSEGELANINTDTTLYAQWRAPNVDSYNVTFKVENGSWDDGTTDDKVVEVWRNSDEDLALVLSPYSVPAVGNNPGSIYMAGSWDTVPDTNSTISRDLTYTYTYAVDPSKIKYTISYDANEGTVTPASAETGFDHKLASLPTPEREGYNFVGWFTDKTGGTQITTDTVFTSDDTVYAHWEAHSYTVKFDANGGTGTMADQSRAYDDITPLTANAFTLDGSAFSGWNTQADGNGTSYADKATDNLTSTDGDTVTLYAQWNSISYNIAVTNDGNGTASASATSGIKGTNITLTATPNEGYKFAKWEVVSGGITLADASSATTTFTIGTSNIEVKATFEEIPPTEYSVTVSNDGNGTATASVTSGVEGTEVTVTATPNEGYRFAGWEVVSGGVILADAASATTTFAIGTEDVEIKANFEEIKEPEPEPEDPEPKEPDPEPKDPDPIPEKDWLDDLRLNLNIAAELGGEQTVEYSGNFALPLEFMEFLKAHPLITLVYHVTYEDVEYTVTIKGSNAIADSTILWYGPLWLLANYGGNKAPNGIAGNGTYVVKSGDTLAAISVRLGVTVQYLVDKNKIKNPDVIYEGQVIYY